MIFIDPSLEEVYQTLLDNDEIIDFLKQEKLLITKKNLKEDYTPEELEKIKSYIYISNSSTLYELAQVLLNYKQKIKNSSMEDLLYKEVAWNDIAYALGIHPSELTREIYRQIIYTYKYCYTSSFFQNNKDRFIPENDFYEMEKNPAAIAFYDAVMKEFDKLDYVLSKCTQYLEYDKIPWNLITYLTQLLGFEKTTFSLENSDENKFREIAKNILDLYRVKGTNYSFELFFSFLGFDIKVNEYYFDRRLHYLNSTGNKETGSDNSNSYEFYLTTLNPAENKLEDLSINEIVLPSDITPQYSLKEFDDLINKYGIDAVLGYSPVYKTVDVYGNAIYKEYTGKVYKYFKTNYIYYDIKLPNGNISAKQFKTITKCLDFLTPSFVMRRPVVAEAKAGETDDSIGFNGDGTIDTGKTPDENGNYGKLEILDSEDWASNFKDRFVKLGSDGKYVTSNEYDLDGTAKAPYYYHNSLFNPDNPSETYKEGTKFRLPLSFRAVNVSLNKYLTGGLKTPYVAGHRVKYFIDRKKNENTGVITMCPYYTTPPYVKNPEDSANTITYKSGESNINLTGKNKDPLVAPPIKEQIKKANIHIPIKYLCKDIKDIESELYKLKYTKIFGRTIVEINSYNYNGDKVRFYNDNNLKKYNFCNIIDDNLDNIESPAIIKEYYKHPEFYKKLTYGSYILGDDGTKFYLYRFGNYKYPINKNGTVNSKDYELYVNSFNYKVTKDYNGDISKHNRKIILNLKYLPIEKNSIKDIELDISKKRDYMLKSNSNTNLDYVTSKLYYNRTDKQYYRAIRVPFENTSPFKNLFDSIADMKRYFEEHPEEIVRNTEFFITKSTAMKEGDEDDRGLYCFDYENATIGDLIYTTNDGKLYTINSNYNIVEVKDFFGRLNLIDANGNVLRNVPEDLSNIKAEINMYDDKWFGYDEQADEEDFLAYNSYHKIYWPELGFEGESIGRPIKYATNLDYSTKKINDKDLLSALLEDKCNGSSNNLISSEIINWNADYYLVKDIKNISPKEYSLYVKNGEKYNLSKDTSMKEGVSYYSHCNNGLLTCIENGIEQITQVFDGGHDYYGKVSDFLYDYHKIIIKNDYSVDNFSSRFIKEFEPKDEGNYSSEQIKIIKKYYNYILIQLSCLSNYFVDSRNLTNNAKDDYGRYNELYNEFNDLIKLFVFYINDGIDVIDDYFKEYYYGNLLSLYRERFIDDNGEIGFNINDMSVMSVVLDNLEKLDGKAGTFNNLSTQIKNNIMIPFNNISINTNTKKIIIRSNYKDIINAFGKEYEIYYKNKELKIAENKYGLESEIYLDLKKTLDYEYSTYLDGIIPIFTYKDDSFYNGKETTSWQKNKKKLEVPYFGSVIKSYSSTNKLIFNSMGEVVDDKGIVITDENLIKERIKDSHVNGYVNIELNYKDVNNLTMSDVNEIKNIEGFLTVRNVRSSFLNNKIYSPKDEWIEKDLRGNSVEYNSLGDDRTFLFNKTLNYNFIKCRAILNSEGKIVIVVNNKEKNIDNSLYINTIKLN